MTDGLLDAESDKNKAQSVNQSRKRRRVSDGAALENEPLPSLQTTGLIARQPYDRAGPSQDASLTNGRFNSKVNASTELERSQRNSVRQQQWTEERIPHIGTISTLLNDAATSLASTHKSLLGSEDGLIEPLSTTLLPSSVHVPANLATPSLSKDIRYALERILVANKI